MKKLIIASLFVLSCGVAEARTGSLAPNSSGSLSPSSAIDVSKASGVLPVANGGTGSSSGDVSGATVTPTCGSDHCPTDSLANIAARPIRTISSGSTDTATASDYFLLWNSATAANKVQTIPACTSTIKNKELYITDGYGNAAVYPIIITPVSGTIYDAISVSLQVNKASVSIKCDGNDNWFIF